MEARWPLVPGPEVGRHIARPVQRGGYSVAGRPPQRLPGIVLGAQIGSQVQAMFDKEMAASDTITLEQWKRRPLDLRVSELFARVWEYWL